MNIKTQKNFTKDYTVNWSGEVSAIKKVIGTFYEKELRNKSKVGLIKKVSLYKMSHFPEPYTRSKKQKLN